MTDSSTTRTGARDIAIHASFQVIVDLKMLVGIRI